MSGDNDTRLRGVDDCVDGDIKDGLRAAAEVSTTPQPAAVVKRKHKKHKASTGRLKKLWRRAVGPPPGITSRSEWLELTKLHSDWKLSQSSDDQNDGRRNEAMLGPLPGPSVLLAKQQPILRDFSKLENWQNTEGTDHRDVLMNLLFSGCNNNSAPPRKKRKRYVEDEDGNNSNQKHSSINVPMPPSWSSICNLDSLGGLAVIEIEINGGGKDTTVCPLMPSQRTLETTDAKSTNIWSSLLKSSSSEDDTISSNDGSNQLRRTITAACKVKLFQGDKPRCMSDVLMFIPPSPAENGSKRQKKDCIDLFQAMNDLLLKQKQLCSEGFPIAETSNESLGAKTAREKICEMSPDGLICTTQESALELVSALSISTVLGDATQDEDDDKGDDFSKNEHFVRTFSHCQAVTGDAGTARSPNIFALDCEMVETSVGPELARVSVIKFTGCNGMNNANKVDDDEEKIVVVLDELVKPRRKVLDYLTGDKV